MTRCRECGLPIIDDPTGSPGVRAHATADGDVDHEADADHPPVPEHACTSTWTADGHGAFCADCGETLA